MKKIISCIFALMIFMNTSFAAFETFDGETLGLFKDMIDSLYYEDVDEKVLMEGAIKGMFDALDKYSAYYTAEETVSVDESLTGNYVGVGVKIEALNGYAHVIKVFKDSPAETAGILMDDYIIKINDEDVEGWSLDKVGAYIRGEEGTEVKLTLLRGSEIIEKTLTRQHVQTETCSFDIYEDNIGYIAVEDFTLSTSDEFKEILRIFDVVGIKKVILDLRNNPGGYLDQAVSVAGKLVPKGVITTIKYKTEEDEEYTSRLPEAKYDLVVLVNGGSASASEIVAGAIKDSKAGVLVGTQTYGKGVVQRVLNIIGGGKVTITIGKYYTPSGVCIDKVGITPDYVVEGADAQLQKAIDILKNR